MKSRFISLLNQYQTILEQDINQPPQPDQQMDQSMGQQSDPSMNQQPQQQPQQQEPIKSSVGYAVISQLVLDAFKTVEINNKNDIKFSDNKVRTPKEAYNYLEIIKRNLAPDLQNELKQDVGKSENTKDLDSADLINLTQLALEALFFRPKDTDSAEFNNIATIEEVTVENAKEVIEKIRSYVSER